MRASRPMGPRLAMSGSRAISGRRAGRRPQAFPPKPPERIRRQRAEARRPRAVMVASIWNFGSGNRRKQKGSASPEPRGGFWAARSTRAVGGQAREPHSRPPQGRVTRNTLFVPNHRNKKARLQELALISTMTLHYYEPLALAVRRITQPAHLSIVTISSQNCHGNPGAYTDRSVTFITDVRRAARYRTGSAQPATASFAPARPVPPQAATLRGLSCVV